MKTSLIASFWLMAIASHGQNLIVNGSFELPTLSSNGISVGPGSTNLIGWTTGTNGSLYVVRGPVSGSYFPVDSAQYVDLNRGVALSQSFSTVAGEVYQVRFSAGKYSGSIDQRLRASILDAAGGVLTNLEVATPQLFGWNPPTVFRFTATSATSVLRFTETNSTVNYDLTLDDVSVERVTPRLSIECSHVRLCWESRTNANYQLQYQSESTTNLWTDVGPPISGKDGSDCTVQPVSEPHRLYRVVVIP